MADLLLLDAGLFIDNFRGHADAVRLVGALLTRRAACLHPVVLAELIGGARDWRHLKEIDHALRDVPLLTVKPTDFVTAIDLLRDHHLASRIGWGDCLIAATALRLSLPVVTINDKHFRTVPKLRVIRPY